jgi:hypothetical protein
MNNEEPNGVINDSEKRTGLAEQAGAWSEKFSKAPGC